MSYSLTVPQIVLMPAYFLMVDYIPHNRLYQLLLLLDYAAKLMFLIRPFYFLRQILY